MARKTILIIIILSLLGFRVSSQSNYKNGFIIDNKGDTVYGLIKNLSLIGISQKCWFRKSEKSEAVCYTPYNIKAFSYINGKYFVSKLIKVGKDIQPTFLEYLISGKANLFYRKDEKGDHYYLQNENDSIYELLNSEVEIYKDDVKYVHYKNEYIGMIKIIFKDCPEIRTEINKSEFSHESLINLTKDYHNYVCKDKACIIYDKDIKLKTSISCIVGVYMSHIDFKVKDGSFAFLNGEKFQKTITYSTGILISERNIFGLDDNYGFNFIIGFKNSLFKSENIRITQQNLYIPIYMTCYIPTGKLKPLINFGVINKINIKTEITGPTEVDKNNLKQSIGIYELGGLIGIGIEYKKNKISYLLNLDFEFAPLGINKSGDIDNNFLSSFTYDSGIIFGLKYDIN
jgi:hypothetical protein